MEIDGRRWEIESKEAASRDDRARHKHSTGIDQ